MIIIEQETRWQQTLWLLSLDDIVGLAEDLWLPVDAPGLAASLRTVLERHLPQPDAYLEHSSSATYELFRHVEQTRGSRDLEQLIAWGRSVGFGSTRRADQVPWQYVLSLIRARRPGTEQLDPWIGALSQRVREAELRLEARIDPRVHAQFASERSDWDRRAEDLHGHDRDWIAEWARVRSGRNVDQAARVR